jgi:hypothetical protein
MSNGEQVLLRSPLLYKLVRDASGALIIEVVVGGIVMSAVRVRLDAQETAAYAREGQAFTDRLAQAIMANPPFGGRSVDVP